MLVSNPKMLVTFCANTELSTVAMVWLVQFWLPSFSYHVTMPTVMPEVSPKPLDAASTSMSPSPSISIANTEIAPLALASTVRLVHARPSRSGAGQRPAACRWCCESHVAMVK